jgi:NTP pyrophosphatase (non-canonical NTP hydrolase)
VTLGINVFAASRTLENGVKNVQIREFQDMMWQIYFNRDSKRAPARTYEWLMDEVRELGEAMRQHEKKALANEFADVLAWLASLANVVGVDLERAAITKYDNRCPKCKKVPCECLLSK